MSEEPATTGLSGVADEIAKVVKGQSQVVKALTAGLMVGGHVILEGVPGVAKTLIVKTLAHVMSLQFRRVQFTPDLMPSDVTGNVVYETETGKFRFRQGPVFTNLLLADELNRTPPKTQAALLEAMEERQVSVEGDTHALPSPFMVIATQNPIEYEGTYPLPEAQLDRFLFRLRVGYPSRDEEREVLRIHDEGRDPHDADSFGINPVAGADDIRSAHAALTGVTVSDEVMDYILSLAEETRRTPSLQLGVSPRGAAGLLHASKAWSFLGGRDFVTPDEVKALIKPTWAHRVLVRPEVELEGVTAESVIDAITERVPVPR